MVMPASRVWGRGGVDMSRDLKDGYVLEYVVDFENGIEKTVHFNLLEELLSYLKFHNPTYFTVREWRNGVIV
tara:strand:+ start:365 stop:580 length:216 start_codon:yes stop_codon:yes gene_type:complete